MIINQIKSAHFVLNSFIFKLPLQNDVINLCKKYGSIKSINFINNQNSHTSFVEFEDAL